MTHIGRDIGTAELDLVEEFRSTLRVERGQTDHHFVDEGPKTPPIYRFPMPLLIKDLRSKILRGSADRIGIAICDFHFG